MKQISKRARAENSTSCNVPSQKPQDKEASGLQPGPIAQVKPKWKWHYRVLLGLRDRLLKARSEQLHEAAEPVAFCAVDAAESAADEFVQIAAQAREENRERREEREKRIEREEN